jgi:4-hydroxybenzoate polyprenyltransferase/phosphoserine phosphatase
LNSPPLVIDLDGTLIRSDLLLESALWVLREHPLQLLLFVVWLLKGKAYLKARLAAVAPIDVTTLPYEPQVLALIKAEKARGRAIILATASHSHYAEQIAAHLGLFDRVMATTDAVNLSAHNKRDALIALFGKHQFDYAGNSSKDIPVWAAARHAYVVNPERGVVARASKIGNVKRIISSPGQAYTSWINACRLHQWLKNGLIFVPLLASHQLLHPDLITKGLLAFFLFGLCASSVYLLNDLLDLNDDRHHPRKRERPFAAGALSIKSGLLVFPLLLLLAFLGGWLWLPWQFVAVLAIYYTLTLTYSLSLKRLMALDAITLALLYTLRIIAGTFVFNSQLTFWLLAFSMFIFLSLALVKRYTELREARHQGHTMKTRGRGYYPDDLEMLSSLGAASGYMSVLVLALYIQDKNTIALYQHPQVIWLACPVLLYWITRAWILTHRGKMQDDPVLFALKDRASQLSGTLLAIIFWLAI